MFFLLPQGNFPGLKQLPHMPSERDPLQGSLSSTFCPESFTHLGGNEINISLETTLCYVSTQEFPRLHFHPHPAPLDCSERLPAPWSPASPFLAFRSKRGGPWRGLHWITPLYCLQSFSGFRFVWLNKSQIHLPGTQALYDLILTYFPILFLTTHVPLLHNLAKDTTVLSPLGLVPDYPSLSPQSHSHSLLAPPTLALVCGSP